MFKWTIAAMFCLLFGTIGAQNIGINEDGSNPDPSAMLDISSTDKGVLIPRLADHTAIAAPATGLLVFNTSTSTFWFFNGTVWIEITFPVSEIRDADSDTWISVENSPDEDIIRFGAESATDQMRFDGKTLHWTSSSIYIGEQSGVAGTGENNTFLGYTTGQSATGARNTFLGALSGSSLTSGSDNTFLGARSGLSLTSGNNNIMLGQQAGQNATNTSDNLFIGFQSGLNITTASQNSFLGYRAGMNVTSGQYNTYIGHVAGSRNATGIYNVAIGHYANGESGASVAKESVFVGAFAGRFNTANANVMVGKDAGHFNTGGWHNTFVGFAAGKGMDASAGNNAGRENSFFGHQAGNKISGGERNVLIGQNAGETLSSGSYNTFLGWRAGFGKTSGSSNVFIGSRAGELLGAGTSNRLVIANERYEESILIWGQFDNKRVGINTIAPTHTLSVDGGASKPGGGEWAVPSDRRIKKDIQNFGDGLSVIMQLKPISYKYKENSGYSDFTTEYVGFIAQDVEKVAPYMVTLFDDSEGPSGLSDKRVLDESALSKVLVNAIQEQQEHIESLEARIEKLERLLLEDRPAVSEVSEK